MTTMTRKLPTCKEMFRAKVARSRPHVKPFLFMVVLVMALYACSVIIPPGWITWGFSTVALFFVGVAAIARLDDILPEQIASQWQVRRFSLMLVGAAAVGISVGRPVNLYMLGQVMVEADFPTWSEVAFRWGIAGMLITTPHLPPFWRYVSGKYTVERNERKAEAARVSRAAAEAVATAAEVAAEAAGVAAEAALVIKGLYPTGEHAIFTGPPELERRRSGDRREGGS